MGTKRAYKLNHKDKVQGVGKVVRIIRCDDDKDKVQVFLSDGTSFKTHKHTLYIVND